MANLEKVFGAGNSSIGENHLNKLCSNLDNKTVLVIFGFYKYIDKIKYSFYKW